MFKNDKVYQTLVKEFEISGINWEELLDDYETFQFHYGQLG